MESSPDEIRSRAARWILVVGMVFLVLVVLVAVLESVATIARLAESPGRRLGAAGLATLGAGLLAVLAAGAAAIWAARSRLNDRQLLLAGLAAVLVIRGAVVVLVDAPLPNDGRAYQELARWLAAGGCCFDDRPTGYPMLLAAGYRLFGEGAWVHEAINLLAAVIGAWLLFDLVLRTFGRRPATVALAVYAVLPGLALLTPLLLTDTVYATLLLALCWAALWMIRGGAAAAVVAGLLLAASQYVRPVAPALLPAMAALPLLFMRTLRGAALAIGLLVAVFLAAMLPVVAHNLAEHGELSVSTSSYGGWSLLMGTNQASNGRYNDADAAIIAALPGTSLWDRSQAAGPLGLDRITSDPVGFGGLVGRKFRVMWGTEEFAVIFAFRPDGPARGALAGLDLLAQLTYLAVTVLAAAGLAAAVRRRAPPDPLLVVVVSLLLCEVLVHTFLEVKPRYHALSEPLFLVLGASAFTAVASRWFERGSQ